MFDPDSLKDALETLHLPRLVTKEDIKKQYRHLAKRYHPDHNAQTEEKMEKINHAYAVLMRYIEEFRYTFDEQEIARQFPKEAHDERYRK